VRPPPPPRPPEPALRRLGAFVADLWQALACTFTGCDLGPPEYGPAVPVFLQRGHAALSRIVKRPCRNGCAGEVWGGLRGAPTCPHQPPPTVGLALRRAEASPEASPTNSEGASATYDAANSLTR